MLPKDDEADGFDNIANLLAVSPSFLDQYISAARVVTNRALGVPGTKATSVTYRPARGTDQAVRVDGLPLGTRGGLVVEHNFPADGDYKLNVNGLPIAGYLRGMEYQHTVVVLLDGVKIFENTIGGPEDLKNIDQQQAAAVTAVNNRFQNIPVKTTAGPHKLGVTFVARTLGRVRRRAVQLPSRHRRRAHPEDRHGGRAGAVHGREPGRHAQPPARADLQARVAGRRRGLREEDPGDSWRGAPIAARSPSRT